MKWRNMFRRRLPMPSVAAGSPVVPIVGYAIYNRGRTLSQGAALYGYGGDIAINAQFPLAGTGHVINPTRAPHPNANGQQTIRAFVVNGISRPYGQIGVQGVVDDPNGVGSGMSSFSSSFSLAANDGTD